MNTELSRVHALIDNDGTTRLAQYSYLGLDQFVRDEYPQAGVELTYLKQGNDSNGPQGDQYNGLDYFGRVVDQRWINASTIADVERVKYGFDPNGNRLWRENTVAHAAAKKQDELYTYDGLNQLTVLKRGDLNSTHTAFDPATPTWEEDFTLDPTGNWNDYVTKINNSADLTQARTHNEANELTAIGGSPTYVAEDAAGNMTKVPKPGVWNAAYDLTYDAWNRLVKVMNGNNTVAVYAYDGLTRRTTKTIGSETRHYYYSDQWQILEEHLTIGATTTVDRQFVWGLRYMDDLVLRDRSVGGTLDERLYTLHDYFHPTAITNISGVVQERYGYDAYGTSRVMDASFNSTTSTYDWETRYGAYRWDAETGLYQVRYRYLHPGLGRWPNRDPIGQIGGLNLYGYAGNAPVDSLDPFGLCEGSGCGGMLAAALPDFGIKNPLPGVHASFCKWVEGKIRGYLSSTEDIRAWDKFVGGTANDIELTESEMTSMLGAVADFQAALKKQAEDCKTNSFGWNSRTTQVDASVGAPWALSIGGVSIKLTTTCACRVLIWEACIFDKYDFDPKWFSTHRSRDAEIKTILVWAAQNGAQCGWNEFHHKGCKDGFIAN